MAAKTGTYVLREGRMVKISDRPRRIPECRRFHRSQGERLLADYADLESKGGYTPGPTNYTPAQIKAAAALPDT